MYLIDESKPDKELSALSDEYDGLCDFLNEKQCEDRIKSIIIGIDNSKLFDIPAVYRIYWEREYSADEYSGFLKQITDI
jgi:hypothetical protein